MKKYMCELVGTFFLVFAGTGAIIANDMYNGVITHVGVSLSFGLVVMAVIYSFGESSGAHINPAVTVGFYKAKRLSLKEAINYIIFQIIGGLLASLEKEKSGKFNYKIFQGYEIGRPSKLEINVSKENNITKKPWIFGESVIVSEGKFYL